MTAVFISHEPKGSGRVALVECTSCRGLGRSFDRRPIADPMDPNDIAGEAINYARRRYSIGDPFAPMLISWLMIVAAVGLLLSGFIKGYGHTQNLNAEHGFRRSSDCFHGWMWCIVGHDLCGDAVRWPFGRRLDRS